MINIEDRVPTAPNAFKINENGSERNVTITRDDRPSKNGTVIGRETLMAIQGFIASKTVFNSDGSITETNSKGDVLKTVFNSDGSITATFTGANGAVATKQTVFNADGSIEVKII